MGGYPEGICVLMALVWGGLGPGEQDFERTGGADIDLRRHDGLRRGRCGPVKIGWMGNVTVDCRRRLRPNSGGAAGLEYWQRRL